MRVPVPRGRRATRTCCSAAASREPERIAGGDDQALLALPEVDDHGVAAGEQRAGERRVVGAVAVAEMQGGAVGVVAPQRREAAEAPAGADHDDLLARLGEQQRERRVVAAGQAERRAGAQQPAGRQLAARRDARRAALGEHDHAGARERGVRALDRRGRAVLVRGEPPHGRQRAAGRQAPVDHERGELAGQIVVP